MILAALLTLGIFLLLPFLEMLSKTSAARVKLYEVNTTVPPPPPPPPRPEPRREKTQSRTPKPKLARQRQRLTPLNVALNLNLAMGAVGGDFDLGFDVAGGLINDDVVFELSDLDEPPQPLVQLRPMYPTQARAGRIEGMVKLEFVVGRDGATGDIEVISSSPGDVFVRAAVRAVERWKFKPGQKAGKAVPVRVRQKLTFELE